MATTINIDSYDDINHKERTTLTVPIDAGAQIISVLSTSGFSQGDVVVVGYPARDGAEIARVGKVIDKTTISVIETVKTAHAASEPVIALIGDVARVYRAPYVEGVLPEDVDFLKIVDRQLAIDQPSTYYRDPEGSSAYWYRYSYADSMSGDETPIVAAFRGDDFGHYASLSEIRKAAGFTGNANLQDSLVDQFRRQAEAELNSAFGTRYTTPFSPVPERVKALTIELAALLLKDHAFGTSQTSGALAAFRKMLAVAPPDVTDENGQTLSSSSVGYAPSEEAPRAFRMGQLF